jgi:uncharacterized protein YdeI (YjbR/CyaY-like superfamily)
VHVAKPPRPSRIDDYLRDGCGRCDRYATPSCKVHRWSAVLEALRGLVLARGLTEEVKWGAPCYSVDGKNVAMVSALEERCVLSFFQGAALVDDEGWLVAAGPNSRIARQLVFRSVLEVTERQAIATRLIDQAVALARAGTKVPVAPAREPVPEELERRLASDPALRRAFDALTPGRRRSHVLHVGAAKQSETRARRVERCVPEILAGRGHQERGGAR